MKIRKNPKVNLENKKGIFFQIGMILTLVFVFTAFEYKTYEKMTLDDTFKSGDIIIEEMTLATVHKKKSLPPPPVIIDINLVPDEVELTEDIFIDAGADEKTVVPDYEPVFYDEPEIKDDIIVKFPEVYPEFPGGMAELYKFLKTHIKYPDIAQERFIQGIAYVGFIVEKDGSITNVKALRPVGGGLDEEAVRVVELMPKWNPGLQMGRPVRVSFTLPIKFKLQ